MTIKERAIDFLQKCALGNVQEAYQQYVSTDFIHHNPYFKGDRASLLSAMEESAQTQPNKIFQVKNVLQDGNLVAVHSYIEQGDHHIAVVHLCRFNNDMIEELWDVATVLPKDILNEHGVM